MNTAVLIVATATLATVISGPTSTVSTIDQLVQDILSLRSRISDTIAEDNTKLIGIQQFIDGTVQVTQSIIDTSVDRMEIDKANDLNEAQQQGDAKTQLVQDCIDQSNTDLETVNVELVQECKFFPELNVVVAKIDDLNDLMDVLDNAISPSGCVLQDEEEQCLSDVIEGANDEVHVVQIEIDDVLGSVEFRLVVCVQNDLNVTLYALEATMDDYRDCIGQVSKNNRRIDLYTPRFIV